MGGCSPCAPQRCPGLQAAAPESPGQIHHLGDRVRVPAPLQPARPPCHRAVTPVGAAGSWREDGKRLPTRGPWPSRRRWWPPPLADSPGGVFNYRQQRAAAAPQLVRGTRAGAVWPGGIPGVPPHCAAPATPGYPCSVQPLQPQDTPTLRSPWDPRVSPSCTAPATLGYPHTVQPLGPPGTPHSAAPGTRRRAGCARGLAARSPPEPARNAAHRVGPAQARRPAPREGPGWGAGCGRAALIVNEEINCAERCLTREKPRHIALPSPFTRGPNSPPGPGVCWPCAGRRDLGGKVRRAGHGAGARAGWVPPAHPCPPPGRPPGQGRPHGVPVPLPSGGVGDARAAGIFLAPRAAVLGVATSAGFCVGAKGTGWVSKSAASGGPGCSGFGWVTAPAIDGPSIGLGGSPLPGHRRPRQGAQRWPTLPRPPAELAGKGPGSGCGGSNPGWGGGHPHPAAGPVAPCPSARRWFTALSLPLPPPPRPHREKS